MARYARAVTPAIVLFLCAVASQAATPIPASQWKPGPLSRLEDGRLTADIPDESQVDDLLEALAVPLELEPGVHRFTAVVAPEPVMEMGYRLVLTVRPEPGGTITEWRPPMDQLTKRAKEKWLAVGEKRSVQHDDKGHVTIVTTLAATKPTNVQIAVGWKMGEFNIGRFMKAEEAPASLNALALLSLQHERLDSPLWMGALEADRIVYKPDEAAELTVPMTWTGAAAQEFSWRLRRSKDLEPSEVVAQGTVTLEPRSTRDLSVALDPLERWGGYRFDLDVIDGGKVVMSRERSAACSPRYNRIGINGQHHGAYVAGSVNATPDRVEAAMRNARNAYISWMEVGFWGPDDFSNLTPEKDEYISNVMSRQNREHIKDVCKVGRRNGIGVNAYLKGNYVDGRDGLEWARRYPEMVYYHRDTGRPIGKYDMDHILNWDDYEERILSREKIAGRWHHLVLDAGRPSIVNLSAAETIASHEMFGWSGVRFDGDFETPVSDEFYMAPVRNLHGGRTANPDDAEVTYANNVLRYKRLVREALPEFEFGFNHAVDDSHQRWIVGPAIASDESMVMNEPLRGFGGSKTRRYNRWEDYASVISRYSRIIRSWGGYMHPIGCYGMRPDDYLYQSIYVLAAQAKPHGPFFYSTPFTVRMSRFITRYAGIFCGALHPIPAPEGRVEVTASTELHWRRYATYRDVSRKRRDYVLQFINPPVPERADSDIRVLLREPVDDVIVRLDLDPFETPVRARLLDPWDEDDATEASFTSEGGFVTVRLPRPVAIWSALVIQCDLKED